MKCKHKIMVMLFIVLAIMLFKVSYSYADNTVTEEEAYVYEEQDDGIVIKGITKEFDKYVEQQGIGNTLQLPETINGKTVKSVLFHLRKTGNFKEIRLPSGVKNIGTYLFKGCTELEAVTMADDVKTIGRQAFYGCTNLKYINKTDSSNINLPSALTVIGNKTFEGCKSISNVTIPANVGRLGESAFYGCTTLQKVDLSNAKLIKTIDELTFKGCTLLKEINLPDTITKIGKGAFQDCISLKQINIPTSLQIIMDSAFEGCKSLKEIEFHATVSYIGNYAFNNCENLERVVIKNSKARIYPYAFNGAKNLVIESYKNSTASQYVIQFQSFKYKEGKITFKEIKNLVPEDQVEKAGILMGSFLAQCVEKYKNDHIKYGYKNSDRHIHVFYEPESKGKLGLIECLDCVGCLNLYIYQSTGLWSKNFGSYTGSLQDEIYLGPKNQTTKLKATDLFEYVLGTDQTKGFTFSQLKECAKNGQLKSGDLLTMRDHVAMYYGWNGSKMLIGENYGTTNDWSNFGSVNVNWEHQNISVVRIKESAANELTFLYDLTKEEVEAYGRALADAYFNGTAEYNGQTLKRKVYYITHTMVNSVIPETSVATLPTTNAKQDIISSIKGKTVAEAKEQIKEAYGCSAVEVFDSNGNKIENEATIVGTGMKIRIYNESSDNLSANSIGTDNLKASPTSINNAQYQEYTAVVYGDVTGDGKIGALDGLTTVKNKNGKIPYKQEIYNIAGQATQASREANRIPTSSDALMMVYDNLDKMKIEQSSNPNANPGTNPGTTIDPSELADGVVPIYTREQLELIGSGQDVEYDETTYTMSQDSQYILMRDIDLSGKEWTPISLQGSFNGNGHTITGLKITDSSAVANQPVGLFSTLQGELINLNLEDVDIKCNNQYPAIGSAIGNLVADDVAVANVYASGKIEAKNDCVGGIIGKVTGSNASISTCVNNVEIAIDTENNYIGGIIGAVNVENSVNVINCVNNEKITGKELKNVAGIIGHYTSSSDTKGNIAGCVNNGEITGASYVAGILGDVTTKVEVAFCINNANIYYYKNYAGPIVPKEDDDKYILRKNENYGEVIFLGETSGNIFVKLYTDGTLAFSNNDDVIEGKTLSQDYGDVYDVDVHQEGYSSIYPLWYKKVANVTNVVIVNKIKPKTTAGWFWGMKNLESFTNIENLDTSNVTDMYGMFWGCEKITELDLTSFDTSNVEDMGYMFCTCYNLESIELSRFNTSKVTNMDTMFAGSKKLSSINLSNFNTSNVTNMRKMFSMCEGLTTLDLTSFDTANVTDMQGMFENSSSLTNIDLSSFNTENVTDMSSMFYGCYGLTDLVLGNFNTVNVTNMGSMFAYCKTLATVSLSSFNTSNVSSFYRMFYYCEALEELDLTSFQAGKDKSKEQMFYGCVNLHYVYANGSWEEEWSASIPGYPSGITSRSDGHPQLVKE